MKPKKIFFVFSLVTVAVIASMLIACNDSSDTKKILWEKIEPFFSPPPEFSNKYGLYRSPLKFYDGRPVESKEDWTNRRAEILEKWNEKMGVWPQLIKHQNIEIIDSMRRENFVQYHVRFYWMPNVQTDGYLLIPDGEGKRPAVITVFYEPESAIGGGKENYAFAYQLAKRGFVTLSIGIANARKDKPWDLYYPDIDSATVEPLSMLGYVAANTWHVLADLAEVDSKRIGIVGHSYGGKWAMFASCLFDKFACAVWSDPGIVFDETRPNVNYWEPWYLGYHSPHPGVSRG